MGQDSGEGWGSPRMLSIMPGPCFPSHHQDGVEKLKIELAGTFSTGECSSSSANNLMDALDLVSGVSSFKIYFPFKLIFFFFH